MLYIFDSEAFSPIICLQDLNFNGFQGFCAVGADDLTTEPGIDQVRDPADVIDVGMGEKQKVDLCQRHRELVEGHLRIMALGNAAVHQDGDAAAAVVRLKLDQVAGAGNAGFSAQMGDGDGFWDHGVATGVFSDRMGQSATIGRFNIVCFLNYV